jgi:hypothetical protein
VNQNIINASLHISFLPTAITVFIHLLMIIRSFFDLHNKPFTTAFHAPAALKEGCGGQESCRPLSAPTEIFSKKNRSNPRQSHEKTSRPRYLSFAD